MATISPEVNKNLAQNTLHNPGEELAIIRNQLDAFVKKFDKNAKGALFVGRQYLASPFRAAILEELSNLKNVMPNLSLNLMEGTDNAYGARFAGMHPELESQDVRTQMPGLSFVKVIEETIKDNWDYIQVAGADPATKMPVKEWRKVRENLGFLVVQDIFMTETARHADVVLPTLCYLEKEGSFINIEGSVQKIRPGKDLPEGIYSDATIFANLADRLGKPISVDYAFQQKLESKRIQLKATGKKANVAKQAPSNSPQSALRATFSPHLFDRGVRMKHNTHLSQSAKDPRIQINKDVAVRIGLENGERIIVTGNGLALSGKVKVSEGVAKGTVVIPLGFQVIPAHELGIQLYNGMPVEITKET